MLWSHLPVPTVKLCNRITRREDTEALITVVATVRTTVTHQRVRHLAAAVATREGRRKWRQSCSAHARSVVAASHTGSGGRSVTSLARVLHVACQELVGEVTSRTSDHFEFVRPRRRRRRQLCRLWNQRNSSLSFTEKTRVKFIDASEICWQCP